MHYSHGGPLHMDPGYTTIVLAIDTHTTYAPQALRFAILFIHVCNLRVEPVPLVQSATTYICFSYIFMSDLLWSVYCFLVLLIRRFWVVYL